MIEVTATVDDDHGVGMVRFADGDLNHLSPDLLSQLGDAYASLEHAGCRVIVLSTPSRHFCAGAHFDGDDPGRTRSERSSSPIYDLVPRLFARHIPVIAVVDGAAVGGGLGLAMSADFRVAGPSARFSANFAQIGMSQGFGLTLTLPRAIGRQAASLLLYSGRRVNAEESVRIGLCDSSAPSRQAAEDAALALAREIASSAPLAIRAIHTQLNSDLPAQIQATLDEEHKHQRDLYATGDFREGVIAARERRPAMFRGI